ncbi:plasmid maintenance system antidote protein [Bifidobacterium saguini DSM 23967]|uniref:Plasmid maintenance system antidote protein n=2 Tax=Bifidobacterium saguini TaxID=762210 RepID=A0A087DDB0_9BIFI|nr:plasmid maintenance system antidote protein [Bifidobacterium saguini DSM 23967]QTB92094.1 helix-turn-helix transcriptional regulator [Bifidobacterium saguini]
MTATLIQPLTRASEEHLSETIAFNIRVMLAARGENQTSLAEALGIKRAAMSMKMSGKIGWSVVDLVNASRFLDLSVDALIDDSYMRQMQTAKNRKATGNTPMASGELLRLGLNQRPSD